MYAEVGLQWPFLQGDISTVVAAMAAAQQQPQCLQIGFQDYGANLVGNMLQASIVSEYYLGGEGDLFKAPEPIIEEPVLAVDQMAAAMSSIISSANDVITETITAADIESIQNDRLDDVLYQCKKELIEKSVIEESIAELLDVDTPSMHTDEVSNHGNQNYVEGQQILKSASFGNLSSIGNAQACTMRPNFLEFQGLDFEAAFGMRRAYSEGDIQNLDSKINLIGNRNNFISSFEQHLSINDFKTEERMQKLSRYRKKKSERNFGRKIKYACRKALADSQPRVRGRFAKTEVGESSKRSKLMQNPARLQNQQNVSLQAYILRKDG